VPELLDAATRERYADAVVAAGCAVRRGDLLVVRAQPAHREFVIAVAAAAYARGARHVETEIEDPLVAATRFRNGSKNAIGARSTWETKRARTLTEPESALLAIAGEGEPGAFDGIGPRELAADQGAVQKRLSWFRNAMLSGRVRWCIAGWPTEPWGTTVYPELDPVEAQRRLAKDLVRFCRVDSANGIEGWVDHVKTLEARARTLTRMRLQGLELSGPGTDLEIQLAPETRWLGGRERAAGRLTSPNMPTEEVFTSPAPAGTRGTFRCSRPLNFRGRTIDGIAGEFERGRLVTLTAAREEDRELLTAFVDTDRNARRLGEVALVDRTSRIGESGRTYENTLLDENAAAHIAFGDGFANTRGPGGPSVNRSGLHLDVMIGTEDFDVTGIAARGRRVPLISGGLWQI
jgi:aminopeptidase